MGAEADCVAVVDGRRVRGKAKLETSTLEFRAAGTKFVARFNELTNVASSDGVLSATSRDCAIALTLGASASKWADKILHPPSRLQKLGVQPGWRAAIVGPADPQFATELKPAVAMVSEGRLPQRLDAVFFFLARVSDLDRIARVKQSLAPAGALWLVRPKGHAEITEQRVMTAGKAAGLVDVKVVAFSPTDTAEKFVIPKRDRGKS